jgi:hypothetical protein
MDKDFTLYEEAFALKELGFNENCIATYDEDRDFELQDFEQNYDTFPPHIISVPTYSQAFRWFRDKHNLRCQINYIGGLINKTTWWDISVVGHYNTDPEEWEMKYQPYEEA